MRLPRGWAREAGAILLLGMALCVLGVPPAGAEDPAVGAARLFLERAAGALQAEADLLEGLAADPHLGGGRGMIDLAGYLAAAEVRVWEIEVEANEVARGALPDDAVAYRRALNRMDDLQERVGELVAASAGGLPRPGRTCPVDGPAEFSQTWGEERPGGRAHQGEDVDAEQGTPLVAVESGTVLQAGWHRQGGFGVWLAGYYSGDVYYYAHLVRMAPEVHPGTTVEVGSLLGWVGSTGNATSPHLHFGWIPDNQGRWADLTGLADPYPLLVGLCR
ncbi:MAG TPA: M23 family metallopeptidase [Acidimicrobiia bacterium]|nr:M23 family metallopeptidase [Acidimicrobiia bacterium]